MKLSKEGGLMMKSTTFRVIAPFFFLAVICTIGCSDSKTMIYEHNKQIWKAYEDGSGAVLLASKGENPSWIPGTKTHIAYLERKPSTIMMKLWVADEDGTNAKALTGFDLDFDYSWSPDGKWIAVSRFVNNNYEIVKVPVDGSASVQLTTNSYKDQFPAWSPDTNKLAYISYRPTSTGSNYGIYIINADGSGEKPLTPNTLEVFGYKEGRLCWSWDGKYIAFIGRWGGREELAIVEVATSKITKLTSPTTHPSPGSLGCYDPHWYDKYLFYFYGNGGFYRLDMNSKQVSKLGIFSSQIEHSRPRANAAYVYFSYGTPPDIIRIQHYTATQEKLVAGKDPDVWGASIPLLP